MVIVLEILMTILSLFIAFGFYRMLKWLSEIKFLKVKDTDLLGIIALSLAFVVTITFSFSNDYITKKSFYRW